MPRRRRARSRRLLRRRLATAVAGLCLLALALVLPWRWLDPPSSAFMLRHAILSRCSDPPRASLQHEWVPWRLIPDRVKLAVIAAEDQRFADHAGFDPIEIGNALARWRAGGRLRGASTLSQQTAKNLFLWPGSDWLRKGLEAPLTLLIEAFWPKRRILEVYLNVAQFGPDTFGVGAASWRFFERPVMALDERQAALLAAVLPDPQRYRADAPSAHVRRKAQWIREQMRRLGNAAYLERL
jgi:monofunctional biosynthetic peptidoglycan transglycosylase